MLPFIDLLPYDGAAHYYPSLLSNEQANELYDKFLSNIEWKQDEVKIFGRHLITKRKMAWYAIDNLSYWYSNIERKALAFTEDLNKLKQLVENVAEENFNACLLNLYHNGEEGMGWHSDDEKSIVAGSAIASISLGANRKFSFRNKLTRQSIDVILDNGSLLIMQKGTQKYWHHALPKSKKVTAYRINLSYRKMVTPC